MHALKDAASQVTGQATHFICTQERKKQAKLTQHNRKILAKADAKIKALHHNEHDASMNIKHTHTQHSKS